MKKELSLLTVYAIATGTTLAGGFFLLPGPAAAQAGPAMILSYMLAIVPFIPAMLCMTELATALPRAGGPYYFLDRSMGPLMGTIGGFGTWLSLVLKSAFSLVGMGAYLNLFVPGNFLIPIAIFFALFFGAINLFGAKESGGIQVFLVAGIILLLGGFIVNGLFRIEPSHFSGFFDAGTHSITATAGLVYISYIGITKVASVAEEVEDPERNLPLGMFLAFGTAVIVYLLGTYVMVGVLPMEELKTSLTPVASVADHMVGTWGKVLVTVAAVFAFSSGTNAGILSASRYPLAMSRDHLLPRIFRKFNKREIPFIGVLTTVALIIVLILAFNPVKIAKLASTFQLFVFALCCLAVIIMRESQIEAYDPGYRAPFYPWLQIIGIVAPIWLISEMGGLSILFSFGLIVISVAWYFYYARARVERSGAILHVFERLGQGRYDRLDVELRGILKEKGLRDKDPFDELVARANVIDLDKMERFDEIVKKASHILAERMSYPVEKIEEGFMQGTKIGATPVSKGAALPHMRLQHIIEPELLLVRAKAGVNLDMGDEFWGHFHPDGAIYAMFFLVSPEDNPGQHLRILAKIAGHIDSDTFVDQWLSAGNEQDLKEILLRDERFVSLVLTPGTRTAKLIGKTINKLEMPEETLIAIIHRDGKSMVPHGDTVLRKDDRLTIIGEKEDIDEVRERYGGQ